MESKKLNNLSCPFPLSGGRVGVLYLPPDLTEQDVKRLRKAIKSWALPKTKPESEVVETVS